MHIIFGWIGSTLLLLFGKIFYRLRVEGLENVPRQGPFIIACNEISEIGEMFCTVVVARLVLSGVIPAPVGFGAEDDWGMKQWRWIFERGGAQPIRAGRGQGASALLVGLKCLREGKVLLINPEGGGGWDGRLKPLSPGAPWLALRSGAPVLPIVATQGAYDIWPKWAERPHLTGRFAVRVGKPVYLTDKPCTRVDDDTLQAASQRLYDEMYALIYR